MAKKILSIFLLISVLIFSYPTPALAQGSVTEQIINDAGNLMEQANSFFLGSTLYLARNKPVSLETYTSYLAHNFHIPGTPKMVYAADEGGLGYSLLSSGVTLALWTVSRNIAYLVFSVVFVIMGLLIMFRIKTDPKTVASIQNSLPKIIKALILITFSYAIAGLLIDVMYLSVEMILNIFSTVPGMKGGANRVRQYVLGGQPILGLMANNSVTGATNSIVSAVSDSVSSAGQELVTIPGVGWIIGNVAGGIGRVILLFSLFGALFETWKALLAAFTNVILSVVLSPFQLAMDAVPGSDDKLNSWVRGILGNLLAFPAVIVMMYMALAFAISYGQQSASGRTFIPPLLGGNSDPNMLSGLIALGIFFSLPKVVAIVQEAVKAPQFKYGNAWAETIAQSPAVKLGSSVQRTVTGGVEKKVGEKVGDFAGKVGTAILGKI
jgi:hypothetical protein